MPNQFLSPEGDLENYFVTEYWLIDQYIGDELWTWGNSYHGRLGNGATSGDRSTPVTTSAGGTNWKQVDAGYQHTVAIKTDGTLWIWGNGAYGRLGNAAITDRSTPVTTFIGGTDWKQSSIGREHTAAIKTDGTLWTWGYQNDGRLGNAITTTTACSTPVTTFAGGTNWKQVSSEGFFTAALKTDGTLWTWGAGFFGQIGNATLDSKSTPVTTFIGGTNWKQVSAGYVHTAAIKTDGTLWTWGRNVSGQLGNNFSFITSTPVTTFAGGTNWADTATTEPEDLYTISANIGSNQLVFGFTSAIKTDGTLWIWGNGTGGRLGNFAGSDRSTPVTTFAGGTNWKQLSSGSSHTAAIKTDGTLWAWGSGTSGRLGTNDTITRSTPVTTFTGGTDWKQVSSFNDHTAAIKTDGTLWAWGSGTSGRLGNGVTTGNISTPVTTFAGGTDWKQVSAGYVHTSAIKTDGTLWVWGNGGYGQLGNAVTTNVSTPVTTFAGGTNWKQLSSGTSHTAAVKTNGTLWTWGSGNSGRLGNAATSNRSTPVTTRTGGTNWKQVNAGNSNTAAVKTDGTLWTWGLGSSGQLGTGATTIRSTPVTTFAGGTNWKQVSVGDYHIVALRDDGVNKELYVWGNASNGKLGNSFANLTATPITTSAGGTNWKQVGVGENHTAAIKTDGTLWTWGEGGSGQLGIYSFIDRPTPVTTFTGGTNWKQVSAGEEYTAAIKTDGTLWTWGSSGSGKLGNTDISTYTLTPITTSAGGTNWKQVSAGGYHTAAVQSGISPEYPLS